MPIARRLTLLLGLALSAVVLVDLVAVITTVVGYRLSAPVYRGWPRPPERWTPLAGQAAIERTLNVTVAGDTLRASYDLRLPKDHAMVGELVEGRARVRADLFVDAVLGSVRVQHTVMRPHVESLEEAQSVLFEPPEVIFEPEGEARVHVEARPLTGFTARAEVVRSPPTSHMKAQRDEVRVFGDVSSVIAASRFLQDWRADRLVLRPVDGTPLTFSVVQGQPNTISTRRRELAAVDFPILGWALYRGLFAIPAFFLWWLLRERPAWPSGNVRRFRPFVGAAWLFPLAIAVAAMLIESFYLGGDYAAHFRRWIRTISDPSAPETTGAWALFMVGVVVLWPALVFRLPRPPSRPASTQHAFRRSSTWGAATIAVAVGTFSLLAWRYNEWRQLQRPLVAVAVLAVLVGLLYAVLLAILGWTVDRHAGAVAAAATLVLVVYASLSNGLFRADTGRFNPGLVVVFCVGALALCGGYAVLLVRFLGQLRYPRRWFTAAAAAVLGLLAVVSVSEIRAPIARMLSDTRPNGFDVGPWTVLELADAFGLFGWVLFAVLLYAMWDASRERSFLTAPDAVRRLGVFFVVFGFYWPTDRFLYIPVPLLLGWLLAATVLLPRSRVGTVTVVARAGRRPEALLRAAMDGRELGRAVESQRTALIAEVAKGAMKYTDAATKVDELEAEAHAAAGAVGTLTSRDALFGYSWPGSPWQAAWRAAIYAAIVSTPFVLLYLRELTSVEGWLRAPGVLEFLSGGAWTVLQWSVYGLFLGYWYPFVRGDTGVRKSLWLFVTIVGPHAVFWVLVSPGGGWQVAAFWGLQVFVVTMVVALVAGEYELFRRAGRGWSTLIEFRNMRGVVTWATSVVVAIGAAVATLVTSGATELISAILELTGGSGDQGGAPPRPPATP